MVYCVHPETLAACSCVLKQAFHIMRRVRLLSMTPEITCGGCLIMTLILTSQKPKSRMGMAPSALVSIRVRTLISTQETPKSEVNWGNEGARGGGEGGGGVCLYKGSSLCLMTRSPKINAANFVTLPPTTSCILCRAAWCQLCSDIAECWQV